MTRLEAVREALTHSCDPVAVEALADLLMRADAPAAVEKPAKKRRICNISDEERERRVVRCRAMGLARAAFCKAAASPEALRAAEMVRSGASHRRAASECGVSLGKLHRALYRTEQAA